MPLRLPHHTPVYLTADIRRIESAAGASAKPPLMERAGLAAAEVAREIIGGGSGPVLVLAGPGNNGGDAFVIARHLKQWWFDVTVVFSGDEGKLSYDAAQALRAWRDAGGTTRSDKPQAQTWSLVVDGLFGIGLQRDIGGPHARLVEAANQSRAPVLAVDIPSGIDSDTGRVLGCAVRASHTVTFIALKPGLLTLDGPDHCGELHVASLGLEPSTSVPRTGATCGAGILDEMLPPRRLNTHKGSYGSVGILGGAHGMVGAALLAGRAALKLGAGRVYAGLLAPDAPSVDDVQPELMLRTASDALALEHLNCIAVGPGLSQSEAGASLVAAALDKPVPLVIDADGLNVIAADAALAARLKARTAPTLLTPHPAEAARLLGKSTGEVQSDRVSAALTLARQTGAGVVLKGVGSICAWPDGTWLINTSGNPGMASAGMGDVLTGMLAALLAQGVDPQRTLLGGVYLHGAAADARVAQIGGPVGLVAGELIDTARELLNRRGA